jgi:hypothetical protein
MTKHIRRVRKCRHSKASLRGYLKTESGSVFTEWISTKDSTAIYWCPRCGGLAMVPRGEKLISERFILPTAFERIVIEDEE